MKASISSTDIDPLKAELSILAPSVQASHRVEAMARGFGFGTYAALVAAIGKGAVLCAIDDRAFAEFLRERNGEDLPYGTLSKTVASMKLKAILSQDPALSANGFRTNDPRLSLEENRSNFDASRQCMLGIDYVEQFVRAWEYLETLEKSKSVSRRRTSYGYKHNAEQFHKAANPGDDNYVSNGMFIAAALSLGFSVKRDGNGPNAFINIAVPRTSHRSTKAAATMRGARKKAAWRNMMVGAINAGLDQGIFGLTEDDNRWTGDHGIYRFDFEGVAAIACVQDAGYGELAVHVAISPTNQAEDFIRASDAGFEAGDAFASGWLERRRGTWLQTSGAPVGSVRTAMLDQILAAQVTPKGYSDSGRFMM
ncbi:hypothetical protein [Reyranella sp.]|uniref:hypothetical protein n=1 Tax=Reyranella sp. TaxID=1929291 RepID=UPI0012013054|nr:hypothetical protein [Reyranella sp.]TAJ82888.1 MAG: hypothetical protein EPO50_24620 [Reyranella sp.]